MRHFTRNTLLPLLAFSLLPAAAFAQPVVWTTPSLQRTGPSDAAGNGSSVTLSAGRNEYESFQIVVRAPIGGLGNVNVTVSNLTGPGGAVIPSTAFSLFREQYVYVNQGSVNWNGSNQPLGAGWYPDGLIPFTDPNTGQPIHGAQIQAVPFNLNQYQNQPIWVDLLVPATATPGTYTGTYTVTANQGSFTGYITVNVWHFTLPTKPSLKSAFLFWTAIDINHHKEMLRNRVSSLRSDPSLQSTLVNYGLQTVGLPFYSGASNGYCSMSAPPSVSALQASAAQQNPNLTPMVYSTDEIINCTALYPTIRQWGYNLHQAGVKNLATLPPIPDLFDDGSGTGRSAVDFWAVMPISYNPYYVSQAVSKGDSVWSYNALVQDAYSPKWEIDFAPINFRIQPGFISQTLGLTGLLYWRVDAWSSDPWNQVNNQGMYSSNNYPGEGMLVYPGYQVGIDGVAPSMRLKWIRDGADDYEYVQMLRNAGEGNWALGLSSSVAPDWTNWTRDTNALANVRQQLGQELDRLNGGSGSSQQASTPSTPSAPAAPSSSGSNVTPAVAGITPVNNGKRVTFTITVADANGAGDLAGAGTIVNTALDGSNSCWFYYNLDTAAVSLAYDNGSTWATVGQGQNYSISNSHCSIAGTDFGAVRSGNTATITIAVTFWNFTGTKSLYVTAVDHENATSGYQNWGKWPVP